MSLRTEGDMITTLWEIKMKKRKCTIKQYAMIQGLDLLQRDKDRYPIINEMELKVKRVRRWRKMADTISRIPILKDIRRWGRYPFFLSLKSISLRTIR